MDQIEIALWNCNNLLKTINWVEEHPERVDLDFMTCGTKACVLGWYRNHWHAHHLQLFPKQLDAHFCFPKDNELWAKLFGGEWGPSIAERKALLVAHIAELEQQVAANKQQEAA